MLAAVGIKLSIFFSVLNTTAPIVYRCGRLEMHSGEDKHGSSTAETESEVDLLYCCTIAHVCSTTANSRLWRVPCNLRQLDDKCRECGRCSRANQHVGFGRWFEIVTPAAPFLKTKGALINTKVGPTIHIHTTGCFERSDPFSKCTIMCSNICGG